MKVSVSDVAPSTGAFEVVPEGTYHVRIQDTDQKGRSLRDWIVYTENTKAIVKGFLQAIDYPEVPDGEDVKPSSLIGRTAQVVVRHRDYVDKNGDPKTSASVMVWERASGVFTPSPGNPVSPAQKTDDSIPF